MRLILTLAVVALAAVRAVPAVAQGPDWYCDPLHVYYPTVTRCPVPWQPVYRSPAPAPTPTAKPATASWQQGAADWRSLKAWFDLQSGDRRAGADFWAANRSNAHHPLCREAAELAGNKAEFIAGCQDAEARLDPIDESGSAIPNIAPDLIARRGRRRRQPHRRSRLLMAARPVDRFSRHAPGGDGETRARSGCDGASF